MMEDEYDQAEDMDTITALEYNIDGDFLATGDRSGRVTVLKVDADSKKGEHHEDWLPYFQFQSHDPEFDFLKSLEIEAKINQIKFCPRIGNNNFLLSTNDKTVKLWKIGTKKKYIRNCAKTYREKKTLTLPTIDTSESFGDEARYNEDNYQLHASSKKVYANAHAYHINSLALNSDGESFISADDLRINWWNLDISDTCFNIVDIKPENMEELTEVITSVQFHPSDCHTMVYSSSRGAIKLCDTRSSALCLNYAKVYAEVPTHSPASNNTFISDILNAISDVNFSQDGRYLVTRDYLTVRVWDVKMEKKPIRSIPLHDYLRPMLYDLYTSDVIFDKFEVCCSPDGQSIASGSYSNQLKLFHNDERGLQTVDIPRIAPPGEEGTGYNTGSMSPTRTLTGDIERMSISGRTERAGMVSTSSSNGVRSIDNEVQLDEKVLLCTWHPHSDTIAVAGKLGLCLYKV